MPRKTTGRITNNNKKMKKQNYWSLEWETGGARWGGCQHSHSTVRIFYNDNIFMYC